QGRRPGIRKAVALFNALLERFPGDLRLATAIVETQIDQNTVEPSIKTRAPVETVQVAEGLQKCILRKILGLLAVAREIEGDSIRFFFVPLDQDFERLPFALLGGDNKRVIAELLRPTAHSQYALTSAGRSLEY